MKEINDVPGSRSFMLLLLLEKAEGGRRQGGYLPDGCVGKPVNN